MSDRIIALDGPRFVGKRHMARAVASALSVCGVRARVHEMPVLPESAGAWSIVTAHVAARAAIVEETGRDESSQVHIVCGWAMTSRVYVQVLERLPPGSTDGPNAPLLNAPHHSFDSLLSGESRALPCAASVVLTASRNDLDARAAAVGMTRTAVDLGVAEIFATSAYRSSVLVNTSGPMARALAEVLYAARGILP